MDGYKKKNYMEEWKWKLERLVHKEEFIRDKAVRKEEWEKGLHIAQWVGERPVDALAFLEYFFNFLLLSFH